MCFIFLTVTKHRVVYFVVVCNVATPTNIRLVQYQTNFCGINYNSCVVHTKGKIYIVSNKKQVSLPLRFISRNKSRSPVPLKHIIILSYLKKVFCVGIFSFMNVDHTALLNLVFFISKKFVYEYI